MVRGSNFVGARFSAPIQTSPGAHPSSQELRGWGFALTVHPHLAPMLKKEWRPTCSPPLLLCGRV